MRIRLTLILLGALMATACSPPSAVQSQFDERNRELAELEAELSKTRIQIAELRTETLRLEASVRTSHDLINQIRTRQARTETEAPPSPPLNKVWRCVKCGATLDVSQPLHPSHVMPLGDPWHQGELSDEDLGMLANGSKPG